MKKRKKLKLKKKNLVILVISIVCIITLIISSLNIISWFKDNKNINNQIENITNTTKIIEIDDNENTELIENNVDKSDPYWDYIKINLISVDFNDLKNTNNDTIGWIQVNGTNINYPFVQTNNNDFYLTHQFDKKSNGGGWVFLDYRNNPNEFDKNTIIYAHGRQNKTMFGSLKNILTSGWLDNQNNYIVKLSTEYENTLWQVFSVYRIPTTNDYLQINFIDDNDFINFANMLKDRSNYDFNTTISENDKILTLSTCYNNDDKVVLHAKLIKKETR